MDIVPLDKLVDCRDAAVINYNVGLRVLFAAGRLQDQGARDLARFSLKMPNAPIRSTKYPGMIHLIHQLRGVIVLGWVDHATALAAFDNAAMPDTSRQFTVNGCGLFIQRIMGWRIDVNEGVVQPNSLKDRAFKLMDTHGDNLAQVLGLTDKPVAPAFKKAFNDRSLPTGLDPVLVTYDVAGTDPRCRIDLSTKHYEWLHDTLTDAGASVLKVTTIPGTKAVQRPKEGPLTSEDLVDISGLYHQRWAGLLNRDTPWHAEIIELLMGLVGKMHDHHMSATVARCYAVALARKVLMALTSEAYSTVIALIDMPGTHRWAGRSDLTERQASRCLQISVEIRALMDPLPHNARHALLFPGNEITLPALGGVLLSTEDVMRVTATILQWANTFCSHTNGSNKITHDDLYDAMWYGLPPFSIRAGHNAPSPEDLEYLENPGTSQDDLEAMRLRKEVAQFVKDAMATTIVHNEVPAHLRPLSAREYPWWLHLCWGFGMACIIIGADGGVSEGATLGWLATLWACAGIAAALCAEDNLEHRCNNKQEPANNGKS